jgi:hypothetical protein
VRLGLVSWFRRPCSRALSHETVFLFPAALALAFFEFSFPMFFYRLLVVLRCCYGKDMCFSDVEAVPRNKIRRIVFCLSTSPLAVVFFAFLLLHRVTQCKILAARILGGFPSLGGREETGRRGIRKEFGTRCCRHSLRWTASWRRFGLFSWVAVFASLV